MNLFRSMGLPRFDFSASKKGIDKKGVKIGNK